MTMFLKLLIYELKTINGARGTAKPFITRGIKQMMGKFGYIDEQKQLDYEHKMRHKIMTRIWFSYALTRVKMKLSFHSLVQGKTLFEVWGHQIITSFRFLRDSGQI